MAFDDAGVGLYPGLVGMVKVSTAIDEMFTISAGGGFCSSTV